MLEVLVSLSPQGETPVDFEGSGAPPNGAILGETGLWELPCRLPGPS